jgi:hypothetical protein
MRYVIVEEKARNEPSEMAAECSQGQARKRSAPGSRTKMELAPQGRQKKNLSPSSRACIQQGRLTPGLRPGLHSAAIFDGSLSSFDLQCNLMRLVLE